jgi:hypothetical protein
LSCLRRWAFRVAVETVRPTFLHRNITFFRHHATIAGVRLHANPWCGAKCDVQFALTKWGADPNKIRTCSRLCRTIWICIAADPSCSYGLFESLRATYIEICIHQSEATCMCKLNDMIGVEHRKTYTVLAKWCIQRAWRIVTWRACTLERNCDCHPCCWILISVYLIRCMLKRQEQKH